MPALALISTDPSLYQRLTALLQGTAWRVEPFDPESAAEAVLHHDVVAVDGTDAAAMRAAAERSEPTLLFVDESVPAGADAFATDLLFGPIRQTELLARLQRLVARADQRQTERELLKTMEFLESLIDASVDAIVAADMDQRVVLFNPSAEAISGHHVADAVGHLRLDDLLGSSSAELVVQRLLGAEHGGEGRLEPTMLDLIDVFGARIPVQLSASLIYERGEPSAIVLIFADLRDRLRVERRLAEAQKKLAFTEEQGVLAELAGTAAHELNQPLTSMMAYAELLQRQSEPGSSAARAAEVLIREAERMADIVRKIGRITRYETTPYVGHQNIFDLERAADAPGNPRGKG